ncbi:MAG: hypothetical protein ACRELB_04305 [Polyangiaceae bacterium]
MLKHHYQEPSIVRALHDVYRALGRELHVALADEWLRTFVEA